jgi:hypothetical protein
MDTGQRSSNTEDRDKHKVGPALDERVIFSNFIRIGISWLLFDRSKTDPPLLAPRTLDRQTHL